MLVSVPLARRNNPHRIRINVKRLPGQKYQNGKLKLLVRIAPLASDGSTQEAAFARNHYDQSRKRHRHIHQTELRN